MYGMLISRVPEEGAGEGRGPREDNSHEYETATELFEIIAKNHAFSADNDQLTKSDLVLLYKNFDLGSRLMSGNGELKSTTRSNQRVETVVHSADDFDSDTSEADDVISTHDLPPTDIFLINNERLDLLNKPPSLENTLCHKFGDLEIKMSNLGTDILFKSRTVKEQLDSLKLISSSNDLSGSILPASLLDYICCKRLEDNYTFNMENIIRHVKHTIDQLKRISNGDYLTEKAKEKWREVAEEKYSADSNKKILAASTSIPLHVERKQTGGTITWDDIVHSEMDIRSLSKIIEKKIFLEVPKLICGSYRLFSKQCADNLVISCTKKEKKATARDTRVDVVLKLKRSTSGHVVSNINSIMIVQPPPSLTHGSIIALPITESKVINLSDQKIVELNDDTDETGTQNTDSDAVKEYEELVSSNKNPLSEVECNQEKSDTSIPLGDVYNTRCGTYNHYQEAAFLTSPDALSLSMQKLDIQSSLPEETAEDVQEYSVSVKKSPTRIRIKSPYENKSHLIDEKKRKKLLEIRDRREKKKIAMSESCKIMKHRHARGTLTPQASSSVTQLSITNKSFYNSIYGQTASIENKPKTRVRRNRKDEGLDMSEEQSQEQTKETEPQMHIAGEKSKKYINKTYYLDDAETEMMYMQMKGDGRLSASTSSGMMAELATNLTLLSQQFAPSVADFKDMNTNETPEVSCPADNDNIDKPLTPISCHGDGVIENIIKKRSNHNIVPSNSPTRNSNEKQHCSDVSTVECKKSIEKLYDLLKKIGKVDNSQKNMSKTGSPTGITTDLTTFRESSDIQGSDSGTSLKHHLTSPETSDFSFNKTHNATTSYDAMPKMHHRSTGVETVVPKVIISTKCQTAKPEDKRKKDHKKVCFVAPKVIPDNPLKAISQLLHEFDNAQKNRHKLCEERPVRPARKIESNAGGGDRGMRPSPIKGRSRLDQHLKAADPVAPRYVVHPRDRRPPAPPEPPRPPLYDRAAKKKMVEIIDEAKEARGEAVRGPSKNSRLNTLAQPKKTYVQAHMEEFQSKYGRNMMSNRLQRLAATVPPPAEKQTSYLARTKQKRAGSEAASTASVKPTQGPTIDVGGNGRRSTSSSPASKRGERRAPDQAKRPYTADMPETIKEKMVAVESYVKNHYGRTGVQSPGEQRVPKKSRVPLLPKDVDLASMTSSPSNEESTAIGSELHNIIDTMIKTTAPALSALSEGLENTDEVYVEEDLSKHNDRLLPFDSELSIFKDNIHTAVEDFEGRNDNEHSESAVDIKIKQELRNHNSSTELQRLENALYRQMSIGNFQKRLRIKNLTITPKQSMQHMMVVQSGDVGSVVLKTSMSQDFELKNCSFTNKMTELQNAIPILTRPKVDWRCSPVPMQISTIGYAFPKYNSSRTCQKLEMTSLTDEHKKEELRETDENDNITANRSRLTKDYTCQTFKGQLSNDALEHLPPNSETRGTSCDDDTSCSINAVVPDSKNNIKSDEKELEKLKDKENDDTLSAKKGNEILNTDQPSADNIEYSTSLDMLVGLLNEIQKITQTQVLNLSESKHCLQLETILNNAANLENCAKCCPEELVTISGVDNGKPMDSSPSSYSFYITNSDERDLKGHQTEVAEVCTNVSIKEQPTYVDKEISADVPGKQYRNSFTDVPPNFFSFPITITTGTSITNSVMGVLSESSTQSMFSCKDILYSDIGSRSQNKIIELIDNTGQDETPVITTEKITEVFKNIDEAPKFKTSNLERVIEEKVGAVKIVKKCKRLTTNGFCVNEEFDPCLKMKRDILVTVYSVLVLTVFAALSFPDMLYRA